MESSHTTKCPEDGCTVRLIYGGEMFGWTGVCLTCFGILQFVSNEEVSHGE